MHFPIWIDLKGEDSVPETVHHVVVVVDPRTDMSWHNLPKRITTDGVHNKDQLIPTSTTPGNIQYCPEERNTCKQHINHKIVV